MKKMLFFAFIAVFVAISTNAGIDQDYKGLVGEWKFEVSSAPYGYEKGMLYFFEKDNKLEGKVKFGEGNKIKFKPTVSFLPYLTFIPEVLFPEFCHDYISFGF